MGFVSIDWGAPERVVDDVLVDARDELELPGADHRGNTGRRGGIIRIPLHELLHPFHPIGVTVSDLDLDVRLGGGHEVERAPVAEAGDGGRRHRPHEVAVVPRADRDVAQADEELEVLALAPLSLGELARFGGHALRFRLRHLCVGDVRDASDRARHLARRVERDVAATLEPVDGAVRPDDAMVDLVARLGVHCGGNDPEHALAVLGVQAGGVALVGAVERAGLEAEEALESFVPGDLSRRHVPAPGPERACFECELEVLEQVGGALLGHSVLGDVLRDGHGAHHPTLVVTQGSDDRVDPDRTAVAPPHAEVRSPGLTRDNGAHDRARPGVVSDQGDDVGDDAADDEISRPAVKALGHAVPSDDDALRVGCDDGPRQRIEDRRGAPEDLERGDVGYVKRGLLFERHVGANGRKPARPRESRRRLAVPGHAPGLRLLGGPPTALGLASRRQRLLFSSSPCVSALSCFMR